MDNMRRIADVLIKLAIAGGDHEVCGFIADDGRIWPTQNCAADAQHYFEMDDAEVLATYELAHPAKIVAVYHSHPAGPAGWSKRDRRYFTPNLVNVLVARSAGLWSILTTAAPGLGEGTDETIVLATR